MKEIIKIKISIGDVDDSVYFANHPVHSQIVKAFQDQKKKAGNGWSFFYDMVFEYLNMKSFVIILEEFLSSPRMSRTGRNFVADSYLDFERISVIEN